MTNNPNERHSQNFPNVRNIRRSCAKELYRTLKKLKIWVPPAQFTEAEQYYVQKVMQHLPWIIENGSNRKALADWWEENVCPEIAKLWNVEPADLSLAFRQAFGG